MKSEREVLQMHLIDELTWEQVVTQYRSVMENRMGIARGRMNGYSEKH